MSSWKKVVCTLHWTVHEIDLHRPMINNYIFKWEMESDKGESDSKQPNNQNKLEFDSTYEKTLTLYINQNDNTIRPKKLKLFLKRLNNNNKESLYGKLIIDVAKFYKKDDSTNLVVRDMESGRSIAPTFNGSFNLYLKNEDNQVINGSNIDDPSFKIESDTDLPLSEWDISLLGDDNDNNENNDNNKINENKKNKPKTLAEDAEIIKETEEKEKKRFYQITEMYNKLVYSDNSNIKGRSTDMPTESINRSYSSASGNESEEELEKDKEVDNTESDRKEDSQSEENENENILSANDDNIEDAMAIVRMRNAEMAKLEEEEKNEIPVNFTEVVKKKKKFMVINNHNEAKTDDDYKLRVQLDQGPLGEQVTRQRRVTFNFAEGSKQNEEDIIAAVKKKIFEDSGKVPTDEELNPQIKFIDRRTSLTFTKPGVDINSVGAKVSLNNPSKPRLSVPTISLNITPGVKGTVGVTNLNLPSRDNSSVNSSVSSPRNRDISSPSEKESESASESSQQASTPTPTSTPSTDFSPPKIRKTQSLVDNDKSEFPTLAPGLEKVNIPNVGPGSKIGAGIGSGPLQGVNAGIGTTPGVGAGTVPSIGASTLPGIGAGVGTTPGVGARIAPPLIGAPPGVGAPPGIGAPLNLGGPPGVRVGVGSSPGVGAPLNVGAPPGVGALLNVGAPPGVGAPLNVGAPPGVGASPLTVGAPPGVGVGAGIPPLVSVPPIAGISQLSGIGAPLNQQQQQQTTTIGRPAFNPNLVTQKRMTQPALNPTTNAPPGFPSQQAFSGNNSPRFNVQLPNPNTNPLRQSTQPNQPVLKFTSESGAGEANDEDSGSSSKSLNPTQIRQQLLQQQQQNINKNQIKLPPNVTSVNQSTNPNFSVPMIPGLPNGGIFSTSGSVSPRSPTTNSISSVHSNSSPRNEASDELSTASFESPRTMSTSTTPTPTPTPTQTNAESIPKSTINTENVPNLSHQNYTTTRRRSSMVNVPVENLPTDIQQQLQAAQQNVSNGEVKNIDVEYEYEYEYEEYDENDEQKRAEEEKKKAEKLAHEEKKMEANISYCLHVIITHQWRVMANPPKFASDRSYPQQVFPIFATILHSRILRSEKTIKPQLRQQHQINFDKCLQIFATDMIRMPATHNDLFLTNLLIILLIRTQAQKYKLDRKRCETALKTIQHTFESALLLILERSLDKAEFYIELFSEANFNQQKLLTDFHEIFVANKTAFLFGEIINNFLVTRFAELLEGKMLNRIIAKPDKFTFGNAVKWNSFLTAFENDNNIQMKTIHQAVNVFIMIESISKTPSLASEVCPDISPALVSFFITHFKKDENIQNLPKPTKFNKEFKLNKAPKVFEHVPSKKTSLTIKTVKQEFNLDNWNDCAPDEPNVKAFSFLVKYIKSNEQQYPPSALSTQDIA